MSALQPPSVALAWVLGSSARASTTWAGVREQQQRHHEVIAMEIYILELIILVERSSL